MLLSKLLTGYGKITGSYVFRFIFRYAIWLSAAVFVLLSFVYSLYAFSIYRNIERGLAQEFAVVSRAVEEQGPDAISARISGLNMLTQVDRYHYSLVDADNAFLAGDITIMPILGSFGYRWLGFDLHSFTANYVDKSYRFGATLGTLSNGEQLLIASNLSVADDKIELMSDLLFRGMIVTILLGAIGGAIISFLLLRQVESFNNTIRKILAGDLSKRLPINRYSGDFREMEININMMLDRLQELMAGVRRVSDNIAHDLRTPLARLRNHVEMLEERSDGSDHDLIESLRKEADDLLATFNAALKIATLETGNRRREFSQHDLMVIVGDVVELYEPVATEKSISISTSLQKSALLNGDRDLLFQAVANLVDNAIKYTSSNGHIDLVLESSEQSLLLHVRDNGIGIPAADRHRVFERFFRVESSRGEYPGNGLGLSLVAAVVNYHSGAIRLGDNSPGLVVTVELPKIK